MVFKIKYISYHIICDFYGFFGLFTHVNKFEKSFYNTPRLYYNYCSRVDSHVLQMGDYLKYGRLGH